jgi:hypothetical protein
LIRGGTADPGVNYLDSMAALSNEERSLLYHRFRLDFLLFGYEP